MSKRSIPTSFGVDITSRTHYYAGLRNILDYAAHKLFCTNIIIAICTVRQLKHNLWTKNSLSLCLSLSLSLPMKHQCLQQGSMEATRNTGARSIACLGCCVQHSSVCSCSLLFSLSRIVARQHTSDSFSLSLSHALSGFLGVGGGFALHGRSPLLLSR